MGKVKAGDMLLDIQKLEPLSAGASIYKLTDKRFPIFPEEIRVRDLHRNATARERLTRATRFHLEPEVRLQIQGLCVWDSSVFRPVQDRRLKVCPKSLLPALQIFDWQ